VPQFAGFAGDQHSGLPSAGYFKQETLTFLEPFPLTKTSVFAFSGYFAEICQPPVTFGFVSRSPE
jgi:hypothetical protein